MTRIAEFSDKASCYHFVSTNCFQANDVLVNQRVIDANAFHNKNSTPNFNGTNNKQMSKKSCMFEIAISFCGSTKMLLYE